MKSLNIFLDFILFLKWNHKKEEYKILLNKTVFQESWTYAFIPDGGFFMISRPQHYNFSSWILNDRMAVSRSIWYAVGTTE